MGVADQGALLPQSGFADALEGLQVGDVAAGPPAQITVKYGAAIGQGLRVNEDRLRTIATPQLCNSEWDLLSLYMSEEVNI